MTLFAAFEDWVIGIASWLDVTDTSGSTYLQIPTFIRLAELEMDRNLRIREAMRFVHNTIDNDGILTLPDDFSQLKSLVMSVENIPLEALTIDQYWNTRTRPLGQDGIPQYYAIIGTNIQFAPRGQDMDIDMAYYRKAEPIGPNVPNNIYTDFAAEILLSGSVMYGMKHLFEEERLAHWTQKFTADIVEKNRESERAELGSSPLKMRVGNRAPVRRYR